MVVFLFAISAGLVFAGGRNEPASAGSSGGDAGIASASIDDLQYLSDPDALREFLADQPDGSFLVDVRTPQEYANGHIPGAIRIDYREIGANPPSDDQDDFIIVYCRSGSRSGQAARTLADLGYTRVLDWGGIGRWPFDLVTGDEPR